MRRMITEKEADKLRFIEDDKHGTISLVNDDNAQIKLNVDNVELQGKSFYYYGDDDDLYFEATPYRVSVYNTTFETPVFTVHPSLGIHMELPIEDPHNKGYLWNDNGIVKISLG